MKTFNFLLLVFIISASGCKNRPAKEVHTADNIYTRTEQAVETGKTIMEEASLFDRQWLLLEIDNLNAEITKEIWIRFDSGGEGRFQGFSSCNSFFGNYELDGSILKMSDIASTKKMCLDINLEDLFYKNLANTIRFELPENRLILIDHQGDRMVFTETEIGNNRL